MAYRAGSAFIEIAPSFRGFQTKVRAYVKTIRPVEVPVEFKMSAMKPIVPPPVKQPVIKPEVDTRSAVRTLLALENRLDRLARGRFLINVGIAAAPLAIPALAASAGALGALGAIGGAGLAGAAGFAGIGAASLDRAIEGQEALAKATEARTQATAALKSAQASLASAVESASRAQVSAARSIEDAERSLADARRSAARSVADAERALQDARRNAAESVRNAEEALTRAREDAARRTAQAERDVVAAQEQLVASQDRVRRSLEDLHAAREQAKRDLDDLAERTRDNALTVEGAEIGLIEAQQRLAALEADGETEALKLRKARLDLALAEDRLSDARQRAEEDAKALADAERAGIEGAPGVAAAKEALASARQDRREAAKALADANRAARSTERENAQAVAEAERNLAQTRTDAARSVRDAEQNLAETRADAARSIADAERNLARTRVDAAQSVADAQRSVAEAQAGVAEAAAAVAAADAARASALKSMNPAQQAALKGVERLGKAWNAFLNSVDTVMLGSLVKGMDALGMVLPTLAMFIRPVARGLGDMFTQMGKAGASQGFQRFAQTFGRFAREVLADATQWIINLTRGFANLFIAFMPLGSDMSDGLVTLTRRFANWSATLSQSKGFKAFIAYVRETGPLLLSTLGSLVQAIIAVGVALAPLAASMLRAIKAFSEWLAQLAKAHPSVIRVIGAVAVFTAGLAALAKPLAAVFKAGMFVYDMLGFLFKGIGLAVTAIKVIVFNLRVLWMVLRANPVGLVITILGLLTAAVVLAYKRSDTFREIVDNAWAKVKQAVSAAWNGVIRPVLAAMVAYFQNVLFPVYRFLWSNVVKPVFEGVGRTITGAWREVIRPVFQALGSFIRETVAPAFRSGVDMISNAWDRIKDAAKKPVNFVINSVYNNGIRAGFNKLAGLLNLDKLPAMDPVGGAAPTMRPPRPSAGGVMAVGGAGGMGDLVKKVSGKTWDWMKDKFLGPVQGLLSRVGDSPWAQMGIGLGRRLTDGALDRLKAAFGMAEGDQTGPGGSLGAIGKAGSVLPAGSYRIGMPYLGYSGHYGADYPAATGTPVFSPWPGRVIASYDLPGSNPYNNTPYRSYGRVVKVAHENGLTTLYAHLHSRIGSLGPVAAGQQIGTVGTNGNSTGPHLHFEVERNGAKTNPAQYGLFDTGGLARRAGLMAKGPMPERVLSPSQTQAFERALDRGFDGQSMSEVVGAIGDLRSGLEALVQRQNQRERAGV